jgi:hypothetical protein
MTTTLVRRSLPFAAVAAVPALYAPTAQAAKRFIEYFATNIRNPNSCRAYFHAVLEFSSWCEPQNFTQIQMAASFAPPFLFLNKAPLSCHKCRLGA